MALQDAIWAKPTKSSGVASDSFQTVNAAGNLIDRVVCKKI